MEKKQIIFAGALESRSGYGSRARDLAEALVEMENDGNYIVSFIVFGWGSTPNTAKLSERVKERILETQEFQTMLNGGFRPDIFIHNTIPNEFQTIGECNIGITAGIETNICRPEWIEGCNRMDLVLTSSNHSKNVFEHTQWPLKDNRTGREFNLKLESPCEVLIEGFDTSVFRKLTLKNQTEEPFYETLDSIQTNFNFLFVGHWLQGSLGQDRKDIGMLINVFLDTFSKLPKKKRPGLILKTSLGGFSRVERLEIEKRISDIKEMMLRNGFKGSFPKIYLIHGNLTDAEMNTLYNHKKVSAMVSFTKGEGFGRPLLEFTATGKPVIVTNWSGHTDFLHPEYSFLLPAQFTNVHPSAQNDWIIQGSKWATVDYNYASNLLKNIYNKYDKFYELSRKHIKHSKDNFTFRNMKEDLEEYIDNIDSYSNKPKVKKINLPELNLPELPKVEEKVENEE